MRRLLEAYLLYRAVLGALLVAAGALALWEVRGARQISPRGKVGLAVVGLVLAVVGAYLLWRPVRLLL